MIEIKWLGMVRNEETLKKRQWYNLESLESFKTEVRLAIDVD